jgi:hypothetical protein
VAAAELTGVIALLMSSSDSRLTTSALVSLLKETAESDSAASSAVNVNAALTKLDLEQHSGRVAARYTH